MAWIELNESLPGHPKVGVFRHELRISQATAVGHLACLWLWALKYAPTGSVSASGPAGISTGAAWAGSPQRFWDALVKAGFLDEDGRLHDWDDYAGRLMDAREHDAARKRLERAEKKKRTRDLEQQVQALQQEMELRPSDVRPESSVTQPNPTQPNRGKALVISIAPVATTVSPPQQARSGEGIKGGNGSVGPYRPLPGPDGMLAKGLYVDKAKAKEGAALATIERIKRDKGNWVEELKPEAQALLDEWQRTKPEGYSRNAARLQADHSNYTQRLCPEAKAAIGAWQERVAEIQLAMNGGVTA